jgi:hypothetical protein
MLDGRAFSPVWLGRPYTALCPVCDFAPIWNEIIWSQMGFEPRGSKDGAQEEAEVDRRKFIKAATAGTVAIATAVTRANAQRYSAPIIDTHVHLYDPTRPQGVPWPNPEQASIYRTFLPADYRRIAEPFGVVGMIETECKSLVGRQLLGSGCVRQRDDCGGGDRRFVSGEARFWRASLTVAQELSVPRHPVRLSAGPGCRRGDSKAASDGRSPTAVWLRSRGEVRLGLGGAQRSPGCWPM